MWDFVSEKVLEYHGHNEKREQRRNKTPEHTEIGALIFLFEIALYKL